MKRWAAFFLVAALTSLLAGCGDGPVERTNVGNGGNDLAVKWLAEYDKQFTRIENSYYATEYASKKGIDLAKIRTLLDTKNIPVRVEVGAEYVIDKNGDKVRAKEVNGGYVLAGAYWERYFELEYLQDPYLLVHEILRLQKDEKGNVRDNDTSESRALVKLMTKTKVIQSPFIEGRVQIGSRCSAEAIEIETDESFKGYRIRFRFYEGRYSIKSLMRMPITSLRRECEIRIPTQHFPIGDVAELKLQSRLLAKADFHGEFRVGIKTDREHRFDYQSDLAGSDKKESMILEHRQFKYSNGLTPIFSESIVVRVETIATASQWSRIEPEELEFKLF